VFGVYKIIKKIGTYNNINNNRFKTILYHNTRVGWLSVAKITSHQYIRPVK